MRPVSRLAPEWWDYTTLDEAILKEAATLTPRNLADLSRPGFDIRFYDTLEDFYLAEALEYIEAWPQSTADNPAGICGPIGPTEQLPLVARIVNALGLNLKDAHFWGMDEWVEDGKAVPIVASALLRQGRTWSSASTASTSGWRCRRPTSTSRPRDLAAYTDELRSGSLRRHAGRARGK